MLIGDREVSNALEEAVYGVFGGPTKASWVLRVSPTAIHVLLGTGYISQRQKALDWEKATAKEGRRIPAAELMALAPWEGPSRWGQPDQDESARNRGSVSGRALTVAPAAPGSSPTARHGKGPRKLAMIAIMVGALATARPSLGAVHPLDVPPPDPDRVVPFPTRRRMVGSRLA